VGRLLVRAGSTTDLEEAIACTGAATRLAAEFRKTALAIKEHRTPAAAKQFPVVCGEDEPRPSHRVA
jgi:hypothetical protein